MIGRWKTRTTEEPNVGPMGFDDFDVSLGDLMRGERATLGKSLLDVQRELRIRANYIAAIENCDPTAFDTPGFIAGYVRSYARYLNMDPDVAFTAFCNESGFSIAHGMAAEASSIRKSDKPAQVSSADRNLFTTPTTPFAPVNEGFFSRVEPGAIGSSLVLVLLIGALGFGGWTVLNEVQRVQFAPVENRVDVLADLDPLQVGNAPAVADADSGVFTTTNDGLGRLYRPEPLEVPVLVSRDAPISTLNRDNIGTFAQAELAQSATQEPVIGADGTVFFPQVVEKLGPGVTIVAARSAWVRVRSADGSSVFEAIMEPGDTYKVAQTEEPHTLRVGESGAIYFVVDGQTYGPAGPRGSVTANLALSTQNLTQTYQVADMAQDGDLARVVAELTTPAETLPTE